MKVRALVLTVLLALAGVSVAPSQTAPDRAAAPPSALDPTRRISQYAHTAWRIQDGALPNLPASVTQTSDGYLWFGTVAGLVRFDGAQFVEWDGPNGETLPDSQIECVLGASDGSLWIGTPEGLARWKDGALVLFPPVGGRVSSIVEDRNGTIWVGRIDVGDERGGIVRVAGDGLEFCGKSDGVPFRSVNRIAVDPDGNLWIASYQGLCRWTPGSPAATLVEKSLAVGGLLGAWTVCAERDGTAWAGAELAGGGLELLRFDGRTWRRFQLPGVTGDPGVSTLFVDRDDSVWIGTARRGIYRLRGADVDHFDSSDGLSSDAVANLFADREGTLWVATSKGVDSFRDVRVASYSIREGLSGDSVSTVLAARDGTVWVGSSGALNAIKDGTITAIRTGHGLPGRDVTTLFEDREGRLWVGVDEGLWIYDGRSFRHVDDGIAFAVTEDTDGAVWARVGTRLDRIVDLAVRERIELPEIASAYKLAPDPVRGVWLGTIAGDLVRLRDGRTETFQAVRGSGPQVHGLAAGTDGSIWAATASGLARWKDGTVRVMTTHDGLPSDDVYSATDDGAGSVWLYAESGVVRLALADLDAWWERSDRPVPARVFDALDGALPAWARKQPQATCSSDGRVWFANSTILQSIDPARLRTNGVPPPVHVQRVVADLVSHLGDARLRLPPSTRDIEIDYAALSLAIPRRVRYRYKLEGHDREWQEAGTRREAFYNDLAPGTYTFRVIACNDDDVWNEEGDSVEITIAPAFYQTVWFALLCGAAAIFLVWAAYRWRIRWISAQLDRRFEERLAERTRIAQDLHDTLLQGVLSASMQLQVANGRLADDAPAKPLVVRVLELMGYVVKEGRNAVQGLRTTHESLQELDQAFSGVSQEFAADRTADFRVVVEGQACPLHPMIRDEIYRIGREAIINALRHSEATSVEVELHYRANELRVAVRDDGRGIDEEVLRSGRHGHFGLSGMRERAERIGAKLRVQSRPMAGTEVELRLPGSVAYHGQPSRARWLGWPRHGARNRSLSRAVP